MEHLFSSRVRVERMSTTFVDGRAVTAWEALTGRMAKLPCRLDLNFQRPGKDQPMPIEAGRAADRVGVLFCAADVDLRAGDRVVTVSGPVSGIFEVRPKPDEALDYSAAHHIEVQIVESVQDLSSAPWNAP